MRRLTLLVCVLLLANLAQATNYYFSAVSGDDSRTPQQASSPLTPWKTLDKLTAYNLSIKAGDSVFFKRGETFYGSLTIKSVGASGNPVYYGAFGTGANPVLTGFTTLTNWTLHSGSIYYTSLDAPNLNIVTLNGAAKAKGRWPNTGWLKVDSHVGNQSITSTGLSGAPTSNWAGGEIVMRKYRFILDRHVIGSQSGSTLNYTTSTVNGNNSAFSPVDKNGFFVQGHLSTLDQQGEWHYDAAAKRLYMHFGGSQPSGFVVKAAAKDYNTFVTSTNFVKLENLDFEGGNNKGIWLTSSSNILIQNCNFSNQGGSAVYAVDVNWVTMKGGTVNTSFSNGVNFEHNTNNCTIDGVSVSNTNMMPGTGRSGSGASDGISISGNNITVSNNRVVNSGYNGINFLGDNVLVERNYVDTFCTIKDDGGGIYTYIGASNATSYNRKVRNNVVVNAIGAVAGTGAYSYEAFGKSAGIYLDEHVNNVEVTGNVVANGDWGGIFLHNAHHNTITNNIFYNHRYQVLVSQYTAMTRGNTMTDNQYVAKQAFQEVFYYRTFVADNPSTMGTFDRNFYARPIDDNKVIHCDFYQSGGAGTQYYTLDQWKANFRLDPTSKKSPLTFKANIDDSLRIEYNGSDVARVVNLDGNYIDVKGTLYSGSVTLEPFTGVVLLKTNMVLTRTGQTIAFPPIAAKTYGNAPFTLSATASSGLPVGYRVVSGPATVSGNTVTITGAGTVTIEATQAGNTAYNAAAPVQQSFTVDKASQTIAFAVLANKTYGDAPFALTATSTSGLTVAYRVVSGPATITGNILTLTGIGAVAIEASQAGNTNFNAATPVQQSFTVASALTSKQAQTVSFPAIATKTYGDAPFTVSATASSGLPVAFRIVSGPATLSGNIMTLTGTGTVTIEASQAGSTGYNAATPVTQSFDVLSPIRTGNAQDQTITFGTLAYKTYSSPPFALAATASSGLAVSYRVVSGPITISGNLVTIIGVGPAVIEASQAGNTSFNPAAPVQRSFTIGKASQTITFPTLTNKVFGSAPFSLAATTSSGLTVNYQVVSGPATVVGNTITLTGVGTVTIAASQPGNTYFNAAYAVQRSFSVTAPLTTASASTTGSTQPLTDISPVTANTISLYPNPVTTDATVNVTVAKTTTGALEVFNMQGMLVKKLAQRTIEAGIPTQVRFSVQGMPTGIYILRLVTPDGVVSYRFEVGR